MALCLVVDDSEIDRLLNTEALKHLGYTTHSVGSGAEALRCLKEHVYAYVLCDMSMPDMSGLQILTEAMLLRDAPPFIMVTSQGEIESAVQSLQKGAYGYLPKPLREDSLKKALKNAEIKRSREQAAQHQMASLRSTDALTGLYVKEEFERQVQDRLSSQRRSDHPALLVLINIDGVRFINSTFGHNAGDEALMGAAHTMRGLIRPTDVAARIGGDVFAIFLGGIGDLDAGKKLDNIRETFEKKLLTIAGRECGVTVTMGAVSTGAKQNTASELVNNADIALAQAKKHGSNRWHIYSTEDDAYKLELGLLFNSVESIKEALLNDAFELHYQPIVDLTDGTANHYEALLRMYDTNKKLVQPDVFIKTAERFGLINKIDRWVIANCIKKLAELNAEGKKMFLSINISGATLDDADVLNEIEELLRDSRIDASAITFEITETAAFHNLSMVQKFIGRAKELGCRFALDDFGVGFSSFYYIKQLNVDFLKIDGSFIRNVLDNPNDQVFVRAMVEISEVFGMQVIAEWVENAATANLLRQYGVGFGQGWHFGKPTPQLS
ncbi:MAG: GGDEF domain-containing response regulator [Pseudomonadota bacterium]